MAFLLPLQAPIALRADAPAALIEGSAALRCEAIGGPVGWSGGECEVAAACAPANCTSGTTPVEVDSDYALGTGVDGHPNCCQRACIVRCVSAAERADLLALLHGTQDSRNATVLAAAAPRREADETVSIHGTAPIDSTACETWCLTEYHHEAGVRIAVPWMDTMCTDAACTGCSECASDASPPPAAAATTATTLREGGPPSSPPLPTTSTGGYPSPPSPPPTSTPSPTIDWQSKFEFDIGPFDCRAHLAKVESEVKAKTKTEDDCKAEGKLWAVGIEWTDKLHYPDCDFPADLATRTAPNGIDSCDGLVKATAAVCAEIEVECPKTVNGRKEWVSSSWSWNSSSIFGGGGGSGGGDVGGGGVVGSGVGGVHIGSGGVAASGGSGAGFSGGGGGGGVVGGSIPEYKSSSPRQLLHTSPQDCDCCNATMTEVEAYCTAQKVKGIDGDLDLSKYECAEEGCCYEGCERVLNQLKTNSTCCEPCMCLPVCDCAPPPPPPPACDVVDEAACAATVKRLRKLCYTLPFGWGAGPKGTSDAFGCEGAGYAWCPSGNHCEHPLFDSECALATESANASLHRAIDLVCDDPAQAAALAARRAAEAAAEHGGCIGCAANASEQEAGYATYKAGQEAATAAAAAIAAAASANATTTGRLPRDICRRVLMGFVEQHNKPGLCAELENALKEGADCSLECPVCAPPPVGPWLGKAPPPPAAPAPTGCGGVGDDPCSPSPPPALLSDLLGIAFE